MTEAHVSAILNIITGVKQRSAEAPVKANIEVIHQRHTNTRKKPHG